MRLCGRKSAVVFSLLLSCLVIGGRGSQAWYEPMRVNIVSKAKSGSSLIASQVDIFNAPENIEFYNPGPYGVRLSFVRNTERLKWLIRAQNQIVFATDLIGWKIWQRIPSLKSASSKGKSAYSSYSLSSIFDNRINGRFAIDGSGFRSFHEQPSAFAISEKISLTPDSPDRTSQHGELQKSNDNQQPCESGEFPLYFYILVSWVCLGGCLCGLWLYGARHRICGVGLILLSCCGFLSVETSIAFDDPIFWRALSGDGNNCRCESYYQGDALLNGQHKEASIIPKASREGWTKWWRLAPHRPITKKPHAASNSSGMLQM